MMAADGSEVSLSIGFHRACSLCGDVKDRTVALNRRYWLCVGCVRRVARAGEALSKRGEGEVDHG